MSLCINTSDKNPRNSSHKQPFKINLPFEIQEEIIKKLPLKSLIRFRIVSKAWKSLIDSSDFIVHHIRQRTHVQHLFLSYNDSGDPDFKYVSIVDDDAFPQQKGTLTLPPLVDMLSFYTIIGSSHGLLGLYGGYQGGDVPSVAVLWNLSIRKAVAIVLPNVGCGVYETVLGFGVCDETVDPKIVKINQIKRWGYVEDVTCSPLQVEVFTLSTGVWRSPHSSRNFPRKSIEIFRIQVIVDGILYWPATDRTTMDGAFRFCSLIISFDLTSEEFGEVNLPDCLAYTDHGLAISKLNKSLVVLECTEDETGLVVWMMDNGVSKSFTKLFNISIPDASITSVREFRKSGELVMQIKPLPQPQPIVNSSSLVVYEHHSKVLSYLGVNGTDFTCFVYSYIESLLLVDQPDFIIYDNGNRYNVKPRGKSFSISRLLKDASEGRMRAVERKTEPLDNESGEKLDMMKIFGPNLEKWLVEQEVSDLKRKILELEQRLRDVKKKAAKKARILAHISKVAPEKLAGRETDVAEFIKEYGTNM